MNSGFLAAILVFGWSKIYFSFSFLEISGLKVCINVILCFSKRSDEYRVQFVLNEIHFTYIYMS